MTQEIHTSTINKSALVPTLVAFLLTSAVWFEVSPPTSEEDSWRIGVKQENAELLKRFILLAQEDI